MNNLSMLLNKSDLLNLSKQSSEELKYKYQQDMLDDIHSRHPVGPKAVKVKEYHKGEGFGEIALL